MVRQGLLPGPRRAQERDRGRDQEGVSEAGAAVPPGREPGNKDAEDRFKEIAAPTTWWATRRSARATTRCARWSASGFGPGCAGAGPPGWPGGPRRWPVRARPTSTWATCSAGCSAAAAAAGSGHERPQRGADLETDVGSSFDDAMRGTTVPVKITGPATCRTCHGSGAAPGTSPDHLPAVRGRGPGRGEPGRVLDGPALSPCRGNGRIVETPCPTCKGSGASGALAR